jgi:outer membrane protein insertion porin family
MGVGFSSIDEITGFFEVSQGNFDIGGFFSPLVGKRWRPQGGGQKLRFRLQLGTARRDLLLSFTEPWFLNRRLRLNADLFQNENRYYSDDYDQKNTGGSLSLTRPLFGPYQLRGVYSLQEVEVTDVAEDASLLIKSEEGATIKSELGAHLIYDTRNRVFAPSSGARSVLSGALAGGFLGGDTDFYKLELSSVKFWPLWFDHVFFLRGRAGTVEPYGNSDRVRIFDRFFLGGPRTLRGFEFREVGPKDSNGEPIGGKTTAFGSAEYTLPVLPRVRAAGFYDIGMVWFPSWDLDVSDYNSDFGFGLRLDLPGFPLHLDYAWPLEADEFNDSSSGKFNFLIGYQF